MRDNFWISGKRAEIKYEVYKLITDNICSNNCVNHRTINLKYSFENFSSQGEFRNQIVIRCICYVNINLSSLEFKQVERESS